MKNYIGLLLLSAVALSGCTNKGFTPGAVDAALNKSSASSLAEVVDAEEIAVASALPEVETLPAAAVTEVEKSPVAAVTEVVTSSSVVTSRLGVCNYERFPLAIAKNTDYPVQTLRGSKKGLFAFGMYEVSSKTHGRSGLAKQNLPGVRYIADMNVEIADRHAAGSVDLVLAAYEPTRWIIRGNKAAVRSVKVYGLHCAEVAGVAQDKVGVMTHEQGGKYLSYEKIGSLNAEKTQITYQGAGLDRVFKAD